MSIDADWGPWVMLRCGIWVDLSVGFFTTLENVPASLPHAGYDGGSLKQLL